MRFGFVSGVPVVLALLIACSSGGYEKKTVVEGSGASGNEGSGGSGSGSGGTKGTGASSTGTGARSSGGRNSAGTGGRTSGVDGGDPGVAPVLSSLSAHVTGRNGRDVTVTVEGEDADADVLFLTVQFQDEAGNAVVAFDTDWDGFPDADEARLFFDENLSGKDAFTATISLPDFVLDHSQVKALVAHLEDVSGQQSEGKASDVVAQGVKKSGEECDPAIVEDRCDPGLACTGSPTQCRKADAPAVDVAAYVRGAEGPLLLVAGTSPADDIATLKLEFLSKTNAAIPVDLNGDQVADSSTFDLRVAGSSQNGTFFVRDVLGVGFDQLVPRIAVTPVDGQGQKGARTVTDVVDPPNRAAGQKCDPRGFDACASGYVCSQSFEPDVSVCSPVKTLRADSCTSGAKLDPNLGVVTAFGRAEGPSLYDPPAGCAQGSAVRRPEGLVKLHLGSDAAKVTITSAVPETAFDTILYLLPACDALQTAALGCNDDTDGYSSTAVLTDVPAGDYIVVVDSALEKGGGFGVSITVE